MRRGIKVIVYSNGRMTVKARDGIEGVYIERLHDEMMECLKDVLINVGRVKFKVTLECGKKPVIESEGLLSPDNVKYIAKTFKNCFEKLCGATEVS